jgi:hypothetical protein
MTKQRALGQIHMLGNSGSCDFAGILQTCQINHCLDSHGTPFIGRQMLYMGIQGRLS